MKRFILPTNISVRTIKVIIDAKCCKSVNKLRNGYGYVKTPSDTAEVGSWYNSRSVDTISKFQMIDAVCICGKMWLLEI